MDMHRNREPSCFAGPGRARRLSEFVACCLIIRSERQGLLQIAFPCSLRNQHTRRFLCRRNFNGASAASLSKGSTKRRFGFQLAQAQVAMPVCEAARQRCGKFRSPQVVRKLTCFAFIKCFGWAVTGVGGHRRIEVERPILIGAERQEPGSPEPRGIQWCSNKGTHAVAQLCSCGSTVAVVGVASGSRATAREQIENRGSRGYANLFHDINQ